MSLKKIMITDSSLCEEINSHGFLAANMGYKFGRNNILSNYSPEVIEACWESLTINVIQNYQRGKGTSIKDFGTFTFKGPAYNLEGTTNQYIRDKKPREPVFLVSQNFYNEFKMGEYTKQNGIRYYTQKEKKNIPIVKLNLAEIAFSLSLSKDEVDNILKHYIKYIGELIRNRKFKGKIMPGLGVLLCKNNIVAVKFEDDFINKNKLKNNKLHFLKKNLSLDMNMDNAQETEAFKCRNPYELYEDLKAKNSLYTSCEKSAKDFMNNRYNINFNEIMKKIDNNILQRKLFNKNGLKISINDYINRKQNNITEIKDNKNENSNNANILNIIDKEILSDIGYNKGIIIKECKALDNINNGIITREEAIKALLSTKISDKINENVATEIVSFYNKGENVEYMRFISEMMRDFNLFCNNNKINDNDKSNFHKSFINDKSRRERYLTNSVHKMNDEKVCTPKGSITSYKNINNNQNRLRTKSYDTKNNNKKLFNITDYKIGLKNKKYIIFDTNKKDGNKESELFNNLDKKETTKNSDDENNYSQTNEDFFTKREKETEEVKSKLSRIISIIPDIKKKYFLSLDQNIGYEELIRILLQHELYYSKEVIFHILKFIGIQNFNSFSLKEFIFLIKTCTLLQTSMNSLEFNQIFNQLKDIIYINGGDKFLFNNSRNNKNTIDCQTFVKLLKEKSSISEDILIYSFRYLVKTDREFNMNDYLNYFDNPKNKPKLDEAYFLKMAKIIINKINSMHLKAEEYFDHLLNNNVSTEEKFLTRLNWIKYLQNDQLPFSAEELDNLFARIDTKKDNIIDLEEFLNFYNFCSKPLTQIKDIIYSNKLDIEDLAHRMKLDINNLQNLDYNTFSQKLKRLDYTIPEQFIMKIFLELCDMKEKSNNKKSPSKSKDINTFKTNIDSKFFTDQINYVKPVENYKSFTQTYLDKIKSKISYEDLKKRFEKFDDDSLGTLTKFQYVSSVSDILPEFTDEDHMRFMRISNLFDKTGHILYPELLNIIYYFNKSKLNDPFTLLCQTLVEKLEQRCNNDVEVLMYLIDTGIAKKKISLNVHKPLTCYQIKKFLYDLNLKIDIPLKIIQKLDIDADGLISFNDLHSVLKRYNSTLYFKYNNDSKSPDIKLFSKEIMNERKIKTICSKIQNYMKSKNINATILFKKFDKNNDGFINNIDFNQGIKEIFNMSPALGDPFFNYLDFYHVGMVDLETFIARINQFTNMHSLVQNNNKIESEIFQKMKNFIQENKNLSDNEIFQVIDKDCDGLISLKDFEYFVKNHLQIYENYVDKSKLERVMMSLSLSKNLQIGLNDIKEFIKKCNENDQHINLKDIFKLTSNQNLSDLKKNVEWTNDIIERFGMFVSEKYDSIEQFFKENSEPGSNKFKFSDFLKFNEKNYELFNGFNLTNDELLSIYTSLDSQKKKYLNLEDIKNKLHIFNFYTKMHIDVKHFIRDNFANSVDAFKFFICKKINPEKYEPNYISPEEALKCSITMKEFFDAFKMFFPNKYSNNTILKYLNKYFNITLPSGKSKNDLINKKDTISFSEFSYVYFDKVEKDETFINKRGNKTKLITSREDIEKRHENKNPKTNTQDNFYYSTLFKKKFENLTTPFDNDALLKIKRILCSSKYDLNSFFETISSKCPNDKFIINKYQFKHILKELNLGLTILEIEQIYQKIDKVSYDGNINLRDFVRYLFNQDQVLQQGKENISKLIEEIKTLIYKYYSNPIICFQNNDKEHMGKIDFEKFRNIIYDMYYRNEQTFPNFTLLKNAFDVCDLRKDGMIDINEWCKAFASYNGKLDPSPKKVSNGLEFYDRKFKTLNNFKLKSNIEHNRMVLRDWETSGDISKIYKFINKNRKYIKNKINEMNLMINSKKGNCIHPDNLLKVIKELLPNAAMSTTQWKIIVNIGKSKKFESLIDIDEFFRLIEITAKNMDRHPNICLNNQNRTYRVSNSLKHKVFIKTETDNIAHNNIYTSYNSTIPWKKKYKILNDHKNDKENDLQRSEKIIKYKNVFI